MILPLRKDFTIREVSIDVRLQVGYDIQGKHLASILTPHCFNSIDFGDNEAEYQTADVVVYLASGPNPAKLCLLGTGLQDPAFFAMITPLSEEEELVEPASPTTARRQAWGEADADMMQRTLTHAGRRRSSPAVLEKQQGIRPPVPSLEGLQKKRRQHKFKALTNSSLGGFSNSSGNGADSQRTPSVARLPSSKSLKEKAASMRMVSDSRLISESLIYSIDSYMDGFGGSDLLWQKEVRDMDIQTETFTAENGCQTDPVHTNSAGLCRRCGRPPKPPMMRQGSGRKRLSSGGEFDIDTREASEEFAALSPAEALLHRIQGFWVLHQGPKQTAPWLQAFFVKGFEAEAQEDVLEIRFEGSSVYMAGGELALDEEGFLHRYGQSGTHLIYTRLAETPASIQGKESSDSSMLTVSTPGVNLAM